MRKVNPEERKSLMEEMLKSKMMIDSSRIISEKTGKSLDENLDEIKKINETINEMKNSLDDSKITISSIWSSEKIQKELNLINQRINQLMTSVPLGKTKINSSNEVPQTKSKNTNEQELLDIRIDMNGKVHGSAGDAVRDQFKYLYNDLKNYASKNDLNEINMEKDQNTVILFNGFGYLKKYRLSGKNTNVISVPSLNGYSALYATNKDYEKNPYFVVGVGNKKEETLVFLSKVIPEGEMIDVLVFYIKTI